MSNNRQTSASQFRYGSVMKRWLQTLALSTLLIASASVDMRRSSFGIRIGEPPAPRAYRVPPRPGPDYTWVEGYQSAEGGRYKWHDGYWTRPPYEGASWVEPLLRRRSSTTPDVGKARAATSRMTIAGIEVHSATSVTLRTLTIATTIVASLRALGIARSFVASVHQRRT